MQGDAVVSIRYTCSVLVCTYSNPPWFFTTGIANIGGNICASDSHFFLRSFLSHATMCSLFLCFSLEERNTGPFFKKKQLRQASEEYSLEACLYEFQPSQNLVHIFLFAWGLILRNQPPAFGSKFLAQNGM